MPDPTFTATEDRSQARRAYSIIRRTAFLGAIGVTALVCVSIPILALVGAWCLLVH